MADAADPEEGSSPENEYLNADDANLGRQIVYNIIQRAEIRGSATFGFDSPGRGGTRQRTGRIGSSELGRLDHFYDPPPVYSAAAKELAEERIVLVTGKPGSGRRAGAIQMLRQVAPHLPLVSLSPTTTFAELCVRPFQQQGYLLPDKLSEQNVSQAQFDEIAEALKEVGAYLVITCTAATVPSELSAHDWLAPEPKALLATYLDLHGPNVDAQQREEALAQLPADIAPSKVVSVGKHLVAGATAAEALGALSVENASKVDQWFDKSRTLAEVQFVAALAFLDQTSELAFEQGLRDLIEVMTPVGTSAAVEADSVIPQRRHEQFAEGSLATVVSSADHYGGTGRRVELKQFVSHERLVSCLHERYGPQLWDPLTQWARRIAKQRNPEVQAAVARGAAQLWKIDRAVAESLFLTPWSKGSSAEQLTAAMTLWWLGLDSRTEDAALKYATRWADSGTASQRRTAIVAFSGSLGVRFLSDALKWIWRSATRARNEKELQLARASMTDLCAEVGKDTETVAALLRAVLALVNGLPPNLLVQRDAFRLVAAILAVRCGQLRLPSTCLIQVPDSAAELGQLWARTLVSRPARRAALNALCACLRELERHAADKVRFSHRTSEIQESHIQRLGRSLLSALPTDQERALLYADVANSLQRPNSHDNDRATRILVELKKVF